MRTFIQLLCALSFSLSVGALAESLTCSEELSPNEIGLAKIHQLSAEILALNAHNKKIGGTLEKMGFVKLANSVQPLTLNDDLTLTSGFKIGPAFHLVGNWEVVSRGLELHPQGNGIATLKFRVSEGGGANLIFNKYNFDVAVDFDLENPISVTKSRNETVFEFDTTSPFRTYTIKNMKLVINRQGAVESVILRVRVIAEILERTLVLKNISPKDEPKLELYVGN